MQQRTTAGPDRQFSEGATRGPVCPREAWIVRLPAGLGACLLPVCRHARHAHLAISAPVTVLAFRGQGYGHDLQGHGQGQARLMGPRAICAAGGRVPSCCETRPPDTKLNLCTHADGPNAVVNTPAMAAAARALEQNRSEQISCIKIVAVDVLKAISLAGCLQRCCGSSVELISVAQLELS